MGHEPYIVDAVMGGDMTVDRDEWLKTLKSGDKALVCSRFKKRVVTISKKTPKGPFVTTSGMRFKSNGESIGGGTWDSSSLHPITDQDLQDIYAKRARKITYEAVHSGKVTDGVMIKLYEILKKEGYVK